MSKRTYSKEVLGPLVEESLSFAEVIRRLGKTPAGSTQALIVRRIREYGLDVSHFLGQGRNCGEAHKGGFRKKRWDEVLVIRKDNQRECPFRLRRALIESGRKYQCENTGCNVGGEWMRKPIMLNVDHANGNWRDCRPENVRFLCPNCHSQTDGHSNRKGSTSIISNAEQHRMLRRRRRETKAGVPELA